MLQFSYSHIPRGILRKSLTFLREFFENLSHSSGNSSKISHIPRGILRKSLTFLKEFFENLSHSSGNSSKISHIPRGILRKSLTFLGEFSKKFCRVIEGRFIPSAIHGLFKSFDFGFIFLLERNYHIFQKTYQ